jgi:hypothetical protein
MVESKFATLMDRHPELVSGSIPPRALIARILQQTGPLRCREAKVRAARWMLKQVQHDEEFMR